MDEAFVAVARFGLGARPGDLAIARQRGPRDYVLGQLAHPDPGSDARLAGLGSSAPRVLALAEMRGADKEDREAFRMDARDGFVAEQAAHLACAALSATPFVERLVAFWANQLTVSIARKEVVPVAGAYEREVVRPSLGRTYGDMILASARSPAMLLYLDNAKSVGPESPAGERRGVGLNENYARELLELHTLGVDGGYGQGDVEALARLLTGWTLDIAPAGLAAPLVTGPPTGGFVFRPERHEPGPQRVLGETYTDAQQVVADLAVHPSTARRVATRLARHFVADDPPPEAVRALERVYLDTGGSLPHLHRAVVGLDAAWETPLSKVKSPWELVISTARALGTDVAHSGQDLLRSLKWLGQVPFDAPSPQGWPDRAEDWLTPGGLLARLDWAARVSRQLSGRDVPALADAVLGDALRPVTRDAIAAASPADALALLLVSPEFQRR